MLRFYRWAPACLSFGRNQPAAGLYDAAEAIRRGIDVVRRPTGGQAVFHDRELTYSVVVPVGVLGSPRETYFAINRALVRGLRTLGVDASVRGEAALRSAGDGGPAPISLEATSGAPDWLSPCFQAPAAGEIVVGGRKLVGSAQRCERRVLLQHGSILIDGDQSPAADLLIDGTDLSHGPSPATLQMLLHQPPTIDDLVSSLVCGFEGEVGTRLAPSPLTAEETRRASALAGRYGSAEWTWRR